jgi:hypothetical protein
MKEKGSKCCNSSHSKNYLQCFWFKTLRERERDRGRGKRFNTVDLIYTLCLLVYRTKWSKRTQLITGEQVCRMELLQQHVDYHWKPPRKLPILHVLLCISHHMGWVEVHATDTWFFHSTQNNNKKTPQLSILLSQLVVVGWLPKAGLIQACCQSCHKQEDR